MRKFYAFIIAILLLAMPSVVKAETQTIWTCNYGSALDQISAKTPLSITGTNLSNAKNAKAPLPTAFADVIEAGLGEIGSQKLYCLDLGGSAMVTVSTNSNFIIKSVTMGIGQNKTVQSDAQVGHAAFSADGETYTDIQALSAPSFDNGGAIVTCTPTTVEDAHYFTFGRASISGTNPASQVEFRVYYITVEMEELATGVTITTEVTGATINGESLSSDEANELISAKVVNIAHSYSIAPTVVFNTLTTTTYSDGTPTETKTGEVNAVVSGTISEYVATANVDGTAYTINMGRTFPAQDEICGTIQDFDNFNVSSDKKTITSMVNGMTISYASKTWSTGSKVKFNDKEYTPIKSSKGAIATVTLPDNFIANKVTFISYVNGPQPININYWKVNDVASDRIMACESTIVSNKNNTPLDVQTFNLDGTNTFTFSSEGTTQTAFLIAVEMAQVSKISTGGYTTFCPVYSDVTIPEGLTAYTVALNLEGTAAVLTKVEADALPQGCGVVLEGTADNTYDFEATSGAPAIGDNEMVGVTEDISDLGNVYVLGVNEGTCVFGKWNGAKFPAGKAYLNVVAKSNAPLRIVKGEESGIENVSVDAQMDATIYNIAGQKVDNDYKGFVISRNGKLLNK